MRTESLPVEARSPLSSTGTHVQVRRRHAGPRRFLRPRREPGKIDAPSRSTDVPENLQLTTPGSGRDRKWMISATSTAAAAFGGLVLGVFNTWRNLIEDRVKLRITALLDKREDDVDFVSVNIVNLSKFPLAVARSELTLKDGSTRKISRHGPGLGKSIRPRRNLPILYWLQKNPGHEDVHPDDVESCIVRTECGIRRVVAVAKPVGGSTRRLSARFAGMLSRRDGHG